MIFFYFKISAGLELGALAVVPLAGRPQITRDA
jgi:hypothetical protein